MTVPKKQEYLGERLQMKQNPSCYFQLFRKQNKQNKTECFKILKHSEAFTATKHFTHIFEIYIIMQKVSLPCISFLQKWKASMKPPNSCFNLR